LDRLTEPRFRWERHRAVIRLRSRNWFFDRPREIPLRLVRRWIELKEKRGALPLEEYVRMVAALSEGQKESLSPLEVEAAFPPDLSELTGAYHARHALRLYASLSGAQQRALWEGKAIPMADMRPDQQALYLAAVRELTRFQSAAPDLRQLASGRLSLRAVPLIRVRDRSSAGTSDRMDLVTLSADGSPVVVPPSSAGRGTVVEVAPVKATAAVWAAADTRPRETPAAGTETRYPCLNLLFQWEYGPNTRPWSLLTIAAPSQP
jgi:hypothetical protein